MAWGAVTTIQDDDDVLVCSNDESDGSAPQVPGYRMTWGNMQDEEDMFTDGDEPDELEPQPFEENPDEYSDTDADLTHPHGPLTSVEKRRAQNDIFREYATKKMADVIEEEDREAIKNAKDEHLSIQNILAKQETSAQITNPRDYQTELFQKAKAENIIAVLDTGSGKTHIATLLLRHILDVELEARAKGNQHKVAFFLVSGYSLCYDTVVLS
jgi:endoribonuclease Dicer